MTTTVDPATGRITAQKCDGTTPATPAYDGTTMRLYLNGAQVAATTTSMTLLDHTGPFDIGARGSGSESFYGVIDEVAVYPAALSAARVLDHYNASVPQIPATTLAYYPIGTTADNPCTQAIEADDQGAALRSRTGPDPDRPGRGRPGWRSSSMTAPGAWWPPGWGPGRGPV